MVRGDMTETKWLGLTNHCLRNLTMIKKKRMRKSWHLWYLARVVSTFLMVMAEQEKLIYGTPPHKGCVQWVSLYLMLLQLVLHLCCSQVVKLLTQPLHSRWIYMRTQHVLLIKVVQEQNYWSKGVILDKYYPLSEKFQGKNCFICNQYIKSMG